MICGIDEAGRGPVIGPMVVSAVWLQEDDEKKLLEWGVKDSKLLTSKRRNELAGKIKHTFNYETIVINATDIDSLRDSMTLNELEAYVFANIANKRMAEKYFIDAASSNEVQFKKLIEKNLCYEGIVICEHGADVSYPVVGAASILAKEERDKRIAQIGDELMQFLDYPLGSGYPSDEKTREFLKKWLTKYSKLPPHTRKSWKTVKKISDELSQKTLF